MSLEEIIDEHGKKRLNELISKGEKPIIVCGFVSTYDDDMDALCEKCGTLVSIRSWTLDIAVENNLKILCINCVDLKDLEGQFTMDLAALEEEIVKTRVKEELRKSQ